MASILDRLKSVLTKLDYRFTGTENQDQVQMYLAAKTTSVFKSIRVKLYILKVVRWKNCFFFVPGFGELVVPDLIMKEMDGWIRSPYQVNSTMKDFVLKFFQDQNLGSAYIANNILDIAPQGPTSNVITKNEFLAAAMMVQLVVAIIKSLQKELLPNSPTPLEISRFDVVDPR